MNNFYHFLFREIFNKVKELYIFHLQKKYVTFLTCFASHTLRIFNILYASLRNNLYGSLTFFTPVDFSVPYGTRKGIKKMYLNVDFSESVLDISVFRHIFNKTVEREDLYPDPPLSNHAKP